MANLTMTRLVDCSSVDEFFEMLKLPVALYDGGISSTVLFRGVGDSDYDLIPSALRTDAEASNQIRRLRALDPDNPTYIVDVVILRLFYQEANRNGLALPHIPLDCHSALAIADLTPNVNGKMFRDFLPVFGLAQHYGLPTRLLDWSFDMFVAAYFAAKSGTKKLLSCKCDKTSRIALWMVQAKTFNENIEVVHSPYSGNPNLAAQRGVFTFSPATHDDTPLNAIASNENQNRKMFHKFTLPISEAPLLLLHLRKMGYDAGRLFPGYSGAASAVQDLALLVDIPGVPKRVLE